jgi:hypothetical protein
LPPRKVSYTVPSRLIGHRLRVPDRSPAEYSILGAALKFDYSGGAGQRLSLSRALAP